MAKKKRQSITVEEALNEVNEIYGAYEDDIPTKRSEEQNDASQLGYDGSNGSKNTIFNHKNLFSDGYQFGDISKTVGASALDIGSNLLHGLWNISEGISDSINYLKADYNEARGNKEKANLIRTQTAKDNIWGEDSFLNGIDNKIKEITDKDSILGDKIDVLNQGIGYSAGLGAIGAMPAGSVLSNATTLISSIGNSESQAYNEQYQNALNNSFNGSMEEYLNSDEGKQTAQNARLYGLLAGATETATENMAGGLGNLFNKATGKATKTLGVTAGFGDLDDKIAKGLANKFKSQVAKNLVEFGVKAGGEGSEEVVGGFADALWQKITYKKGEKYWDLVKDQNIPESALSAAISSAIMQSPQFVQTTKTGRDFITNMTPQEESSYNVILSNKQKQLMKDKTINNEIDTKYKGLTDEEKTQKYQELSTAYDNYDIKPTKLTRDEIEQTENEAYQEMYNQTQNNPQADEQNLLNNEQQNTNSVNDFQVKNANDTEDYDSTIAYKYQKSDNEKIEQLRQDIVNNTNWNNSEKTHNYVNMLEKIITDKDIAIKIDGNLQDDKGRVANGSYSNGVITINPNSDRAGEFLAIHELTHAIGTNDMMNIVKKYMDSNEEFKANVQSLLKTYNKSEIDEEALADVSGQLFGNQEFINNIAQTRPNFFKRIYNEIKYLYHQFTGYKNQDQFVNDLYNKWTENYNSNKQLNDNESFLKAKLDNGESTVVSEDINGTNPTDREAKRSLENMLGIKYINEGNSKEISIENEDIGKYLHDGYNNYKSARLKKRIAGNYGEIIEIAKEDIQASKPNYKGSNRGKQGFDYYNVNLTYPIRDANGNIVDYKNYEARLVVRKDNGGNFAYDLDNFSIKNGATLDKSSLSIASDKSDSGSSNKSIPPTQQNVNDNTKYSIQESENNSGSFSMDNQGRKLSKEQQEYFKNSKVRDENNNLLTMYHSTDSDFNTFSYDNLGKTGLAYGEGFYFTDSEKAKNAYGNNTKTVYLDISKPMEIGKRTMTKNDFRKLAEAVNKKTNGQLEADYGSIDDAVQSYEYGGDDIDLVNELKNESGLSNAEYYNLLRDTLGYDGIKANNKNNGEDGNYWIAFNSNQIKNIDNTNPTSNPDIRYSKGNQSWREYLEKNFKTEGSTTKFSELEINNNQQKQEILNKAKQAEQINPDFKGLSDDIKNNYLNNKDIKLDDINEYLDNILKENEKKTQKEANSILNESTYKEDAQRKKDYMKFKNDNTAYKKEEVNNALMSVKANRNGKRTVNQWKEVANQIGQQLAINNRNENYVQRIAFKSWFDLQPNTKESITRYDNQTKQNQAFQKFTSDDWVNTIYKSYKEQMQNITNNNKIQNNQAIQKEVPNQIQDKEMLPTKETINETQNEKIARILDTPTKQDKSNRNWAIFKSNVFDKGIVFEELEDKRNKANKTFKRPLQAKWDATLSASSKGQYAIGNARYEYNQETKTRKQISKSLSSIIDEVGENTDEFQRYMYHQLNVDRMTLKDRFDIDNKPVFGNNISSTVSEQEIKDIEKKHPEFRHYAQDVYDYNNANRQELVKSGVISQETADLFQKMYPHYVPIHRVDENGNAINVPLDTGRTGVNNPIKKAKGGNKNIEPLFETMASRTMQTYRASARNQFGQELYKTLNNLYGISNSKETANVDDIVENIGDNEDLQKNNGKPTFTIFDNGEKVTYPISQDMYDALKPLDNSSILSKTFVPTNKINNFRRGILTEYNPVFSLTNPIKDTQDVLFNSQHAAKTYTKIPEAYHQILSKGYYYNEYMENGGEQNSYFKDGEFENIKKDNSFKSKVTLPLKAIAKVNDVIETSTRLAEYIASRENGKSVDESMLDASRVTTNFKAGGDVTKFLNRNGATFLNASMQGAIQQVRNIKEANIKGIKGWTNLAIKTIGAGIVPLILNHLIWKDDKDYAELQDYAKDNYYIIGKLKNGNFIRIPKGRTIATVQKIFSNADKFIQNRNNETTFDIDKVSKEFWKDLIEDVDFAKDNVAPNNPINENIISPIVQVAKNNAWYGGDIVPKRLQDKPAEEQYDESTDELSKLIGRTFKVSPYKVNYLLDQYSGGVGDVLLPMGTKQAETNALTDKFTTNPTMKNKYPGELFEKIDELQVNSNSEKATDTDKLKYKYMSSVQNDLNKLYQQKRDIENSDLSDNDKKLQVQEVQKFINEMSKNALETIDNMKEVKENYATIGDEQYIKVKDDWKKLNDKTKSKLNGVSLKTYADYKNKIAKYDSDDDDKENDPINWDGEEETINSRQKMRILASANYSKREKANIYSNFINSRDSNFYMINQIGTDIDDYLDFKSQKFENDEDYTTKEQYMDYLDESDIPLKDKELLFSTKYTLNEEQKDELFDYIDNSSLNRAEKLELFKNLKGFKVLENGNISY